MTLLTICQNVAGEAGWGIPGSIVGNSDDTAVLLLKLANRSGGLLARKPWQMLQKEYTFPLVNGTDNYAFPTDYGYFQDYTIWDRNQFWALRGGLNGTDWQALKSGVQSTTPRQRFRIWKGRIYIHPIPANTDTLVIEYISNQWVAVAATPTVGSKSAFTLDSDVAIIDESIIEMDVLWRFLNRKGMAYAEEKDQAQRHIDDLFGNDAPREPRNFGGDQEYPWPPFPTVPTTGFS